MLAIEHDGPLRFGIRLAALGEAQHVHPLSVVRSGLIVCIFSQPVISVNNTQIFARKTESNSQFVVYQMNYESAHQNAMILPVPVRRPAHEDSLRFIDLSHYETFFDDLANGFPLRREGIGCSAGTTTAAVAELEVFKVGNYIASFVPTLADFSRLDERFTLPKATWAKIPQYQHYGFAVFQLAEGALKPHPMAFEFESEIKSLYFPTVHIHDGQVHPTEEFDHVLYLQHAGIDSQVSGYVNYEAVDRTTGLIRSDRIAQEFCKIDDARGILLPNLLVHKKIIRGNHENVDTEIATQGHPTSASFSWRSWLPTAGWLLFFAAVGWLLVRRQRLKRRKPAQPLAPDAKSPGET
ncbi:MAG TPA: hypothetical protein VMP01_21505 [Pirellulaceae bacterium]|nr:hypothetical protein [Pirellulaceae bacterium]